MLLSRLILWLHEHHSGKNADERVYQLLLGYHADATSRKSDGYSALDIAMICGSDNLLKLITDSLSKAAQPPPYQISDIRMLRMDDTIQTQFKLFLNGDAERKTVDAIVTDIKKMPDPEEEKAILAFSNNEFQLDNDPDQSRLTASIKKDLRKANSMTEIIRNGRGMLIGFNMFNLIQTDEPDKLTWYCNLSFVIPEYRQTRIIPLLSWRAAIATQGICPDKTIIIEFQSIHPNSYRLVKNQAVVHYPMYKTDQLERENDKLLQAIDIEPATQFCHDDMVCYVKDQIQLREPYTPGNSFLFKLFSQHMDLQSSGSTQFRAMSVMVHVSWEFFVALEELCTV